MSAGISILMKRGDAEAECGVSRHHLEQGVREGRVGVYSGRAAGRHGRFYRVDVEALGRELAVRLAAEREGGIG
jgi:hypothetical protein